jgi:hypothetical protein
MLVIRLPTAFTDATLPTLAADDVLVGDNDGVRFLFDFARSDCWAGTPTDAAVIHDLSGSGDAEWERSVDSIATITGNGLDLTANIAFRTACIHAPTSLASALYGGGASLQHWLACIYVKLPTAGNWWTQASIAPMLKFAADNYTNGPEHFLIAVHNTPSLQLRRGLTTGTVEQTILSGANLTVHQGLFTQIAAYRTAAGTVLRCKSSGGTTSVTTAAAAVNNQNFGTLRCQIGSGTGASWFLYGAGAPRIYRGWIEDLALSGRTPATVADADYTRTIARGVFT